MQKKWELQTLAAAGLRRHQKKSLCINSYHHRLKIAILDDVTTSMRRFQTPFGKELLNTSDD